MKEKDCAFRRQKFRVGHKKPPPLSSTDVNLKSKKIKILFQKGIQDKPEDKHSNYLLVLNEKLSSIFQHNDNIRRSAADSLLEITKNYPEIIYENIDRVLNITSTCWLDNDSHVRNSIYKMTLELFQLEKLDTILPFSELLSMQIKGVLSHIRNDVRIDGLTFLNNYLFMQLGIYRDKFITLKYLLEWSPLICRIVLSSNFCKTLDGIYTIAVTIREIIYQLLTRIGNRYDSETYNINFEKIRNVLMQLNEALYNLFFEIISKREQKYNDRISVSGMSAIGNQKRSKYEGNNSLIRIKRSIIPNIPTFVPCEREYILSLLTSLVLDAIYCITKYGHNYVEDNKIFKIINYFRNQQDLDDLSKDFILDEIGISLNLIERLLILKLSSLSLSFFQEKLDNKVINELICNYCQIFNKYSEFNNSQIETLFNFKRSNIFDLVFLRGVEIMYLGSYENKQKEFFSPNKYISLNLLLIILEIRSILNKFKEMTSEKLTVINPENYNFLSENLNLMNALVQTKTAEDDVSIEEIVQMIFVNTFMSNNLWVNEKGELTFAVFNNIIILPFLMNSIGYSQNYFVEEKFSIWSNLEHILVSINSYCSKSNKLNEPTINDIFITRSWISNIPKFIYLLFNVSVSELRKFPKGIICNLLYVLEGYLKDCMIPQIKDNELTLNISKGLMSLFVNTKYNNRKQINNIISNLPYQSQKAIISTISYWSAIPDKFLIIMLEQVLIFLKNECNFMFSFFIIQTLILDTNDLLLPLETKMSIINTIILDCECKLEIKFQFFSLLSECLIGLYEVYFHTPGDELHTYGSYYLFFKEWLVPLLSEVYKKSILKRSLINLCIFFNIIISKLALIDTNISTNHEKQICKLNFVYPDFLKEMICISIIYFSKFEFFDYKSEDQNISIFYETLISDIDINRINQAKIGSIRENFPIKKLRCPILCILFVWKSYMCFAENTTDIAQIENIKYTSLNSIIKYIFEQFIRKKHEESELDFLNLLTFTLVSIWWLNTSRNMNFLHLNELEAIFKLIEDYLLKNNQELFINIYEFIRNRVTKNI